MIYTLTLNPALDKELTVDEVIFDAVLRASESRVDWGGKGFNVSRALAALGGSSIALGFIGGTTGKKLRVGLEALGIKTDFVTISGETRTNTSIVMADRSRYLKVNESGPTINQKELDALVHKCQTLVRPGDWWILAGSLPPGVPPDFYAQLIEILRSEGAFTLLDTSGEPLVMGCQQKPYLVKPNHIEASELTGIEFSADNAPIILSKIHAMGVQNIVISLGKDGALLSDGSTVWAAGAPEIAERNPIGAGDSLISGLVWALSQELSMPEALAWSVACGGAAASQDGTAVGSFDMVKNLLDEVHVEMVAEVI